MNIASQLRHFLTFLAGHGGLFLSWHIIAPDQAAAVDTAGADLIDPIIIIGAGAAGVARLLLGWISSLIGRWAGLWGPRKQDSLASDNYIRKHPPPRPISQGGTEAGSDSASQAHHENRKSL
jgi:hypothetical protein